MTPLRDVRGRCSVCGRAEGHKDWCARIAAWLGSLHEWVDPGCSVEGCEDGHHARQLCRHHYMAWYRAQKAAA